LSTIALRMAQSYAITWAKPIKEGGYDVKAIASTFGWAQTAAASIEMAYYLLKTVHDSVQPTTDFAIDETKYGISSITARDRSKKFLSFYGVHHSIAHRVWSFVRHGQCLPKFELPAACFSLTPIWKSKYEKWWSTFYSKTVMNKTTQVNFQHISDSILSGIPLSISSSPFQLRPPDYLHRPFEAH